MEVWGRAAPNQLEGQMTEKNKERTSITIDPDLLARAREYCKAASEKQGRKVSFSEVVSGSLQRMLDLLDAD